MKTPLLLAALLLSSASFVSAAPHGILWAKGARASIMKKGGPKAAGGNVNYYGGPVIPHAKVTVVFWGDKVDSETQANIGAFYTNMLDSTYMDWLSEYNTSRTAMDGRDGTHQTIGRGTYAGSVTIKPGNTAKSLTDAMVQAELDAQIAAGHLPKADENSLYMIYFPAGVSIAIDGQKSCSSFCAYHEGFKSPRDGSSIFYGVMPVCGFGCGFGGSTFESLSIVSSHECIEAVTDPFPTPGDNPAYPQAWNDAGGQEVGDLCAQGNSTVTGHGLTSAVQWEYDNSISGCNQGPWAQSALSPANLAFAPLNAPRQTPLLEQLRASSVDVFSGL